MFTLEHSRADCSKDHNKVIAVWLLPSRSVATLHNAFIEHVLKGTENDALLRSVQM